MPDEVYRFFVSLSLKVTELLSKSMFEVEGENAYLNCKDAILNDDSLTTTWASLFVNDEVNEVIRDLEECMCHEIFCMVSEYFIRVQFVDALHHLKESIPKKKKLALRAKISAATGGSKRKAPEIDNSYVCPKCKIICPDEPQTAIEQSIGCDGCNRWYHQLCVGLGDTSNLKIWKCGECKKTKVPRRC
ncbi:MAG: PHD finger domain-containing protein [Sedimenticola sp.]